MKSSNMKISQEALLLIGLIIILIVINQNPMLSAVVAFFIVYMVAFTTTRDFTKSFLAAILIMLMGLMWRRNNLSKEFFFEGMENQTDEESNNSNSNPNQIVRIDETQITEETEPSSNEDESENDINKLIDGSATGNSGLSSDDIEYFNSDEVTNDSMGIDPNDIISPDLDNEKVKKEKNNSELLSNKPINAMNPAEVQREMFRHINVTKQLTEALENLSPVLQQGQGVLKAFENLKMGKKSGAKSFADSLRDIDSLLGTKNLNT